MPDSLITLLPFEFWIAVVAIGAAAAYSISQIRNGIGLPLLAVLGTVGFWYVGDVVYNNYAENHYLKFSPEILSEAWVQVTIFIAGMMLSLVIIHPVVNSDCQANPSRVFHLIHFGPGEFETQYTINLFAKICWAVWAGLIGLAFFNIGVEAYRFVLPMIGSPINPFLRARVGGGAMSAIFALAGNLHVLVAAGFGLVAALSKDPRVRFLALIGCLMTWPYFLFSRTRNTMLAACVPGVISWLFVRLRIPLTAKILLLCGAIFVGDTWLRFVMEARNEGRSVFSYFLESDTDEIVSTETKHAGLNMYEELCWLAQLINEGSYQPNNGQRYFAEIVNPVPRALWPGKPMIGIEYAVARGQAWEQAEGVNAGVGATISTGLIGQGVDNFGTLFGPIASGIIMALWVVLLARIDLHAQSQLRLPLYLIGLVLTFNCGRDITLLVLYPFVFGLILVKLLEYRAQQVSAHHHLGQR